MAARPSVRVHGANGKFGTSIVALPTVFLTPIRADLVNTVHTNMAKNHRQAYAVSEEAGHQTSAESWGTGRAVARIPRVPGGGTHRAGQGAFGNMCRGGRMFAPTKTWRRWHRKSNLTQRRYAVASALAASAVPALVMARGHRINRVEEVPLVVADEAFAAVKKTKEAIKVLQKVNAFSDVQKALHSKKLRAGVGKMRNRRYRRRRGPLLVYTDKSAPFVRAFRNIPGVETLNVNRLNLLRLAPGGHIGRFIVWTRDAFSRLDSIFGTHKKASEAKTGFNLPRAALANADINRIINSEEVQSILRRTRRPTRRATIKKNPLTNIRALRKINPYALVEKRNAIRQSKKTAAARAKAVAEKRKYNPKAGQAVRKEKKGKDGKVKKPLSKKAFHKQLVSPAKNKDSPFN